MHKITINSGGIIKLNLKGTMQINNNGILNIGGLEVDKLVEEYGTPLLVYDEKEIENNINKYLSGLDSYPGKVNVFYASKAFSNRTIYRILKKRGLGIDVVSGGELYRALQADFPSERIYFHGNNKLKSEIKMGLKNNVGRFVIDNAQEARTLNKIAGKLNKKSKALLRLNPGIEAHTHEFMVTANNDSKFGVSIANGTAFSLVEDIVNYDNIELTGIYAHIGSQIYEKHAYIKLVDIMVKFMNKIRNKKGVILSQLDLGGGLGIAQTEKDSDVPIELFLKDICDKVVEECGKNEYPLPELSVEPGRSIIGPAGTTLYRVGMIKEIDGIKKYVTVDGGMPDNIRPSLYGASYEAFLANRCQDKTAETVTIAGKCCESGDILIDGLKLPEAQTGDILAVPSTGAYTYALSNNYNGIPRPAVILVKDGKSRVIIERESYDDLLNNDIIPEGY